MPKVNGIVVCNSCASKNVTTLGHGGYKQGSNGFGDQRPIVGYQCLESNCKSVWSE
jgi:hypothetical protein